MTLEQQIRDAVANDDAAAVGRIADDMRGRGFTYSRTWRLFNNVTGINAADFDELLRGMKR